MTYEHRGHEQDPIQGLARFPEVAPHHQNAPLWEQGLKLYAEYIERTSDVCTFNMLPAQIYDKKHQARTFYHPSKLWDKRRWIKGSSRSNKDRNTFR